MASALDYVDLLPPSLSCGPLALPLDPATSMEANHHAALEDFFPKDLAWFHRHGGNHLATNSARPFYQ